LLLSLLARRLARRSFSEGGSFREGEAVLSPLLVIDRITKKIKIA
jgi:hypothetical protein